MFGAHLGEELQGIANRLEICMISGDNKQSIGVSILQLANSTVELTQRLG